MNWIEHYFWIRLCLSSNFIIVSAVRFPDFDFGFGKFGLLTFVHLFGSVVKVIALKFGLALNCSMVSEYSNIAIIGSI